MRVAMAWEPSVLPLSATMISPLMRCSPNARWAFAMQASKVSASLRQGITTDTSSVVPFLGKLWVAISFDLESTSGTIMVDSPKVLLLIVATRVSTDANRYGCRLRFDLGFQ